LKPAHLRASQLSLAITVRAHFFRARTTPLCPLGAVDRRARAPRSSRSERAGCSRDDYYPVIGTDGTRVPKSPIMCEHEPGSDTAKNRPTTSANGDAAVGKSLCNHGPARARRRAEAGPAPGLFAPPHVAR